MFLYVFYQNHNYITMKTSTFLFVIFYLLFIHSSGFANHKLIIYCERPINKIMVKNSKNGQIKEFKSWKKTSDSFFVEIESLVNNYFIVNYSAKYRFYSINNEISTSWLDFEIGEEITFEDIFAYKKAEKYSSSEFIMSNYLGNPLFEDSVILRNSHHDLFWAKNNQTCFSSPGDVFIAWKKDWQVSQLLLYDLDDLKLIWKTESPADTFFSVKCLPARMQLSKGKIYLLSAEVKKQKQVKHQIKKISFQLIPLQFIQPPKNSYLTKKHFSIEWQANKALKKLVLWHNNKPIKIWKDNLQQQTQLTFSDIKKLSLKADTNYALSFYFFNDKKITYQLNFILDRHEYKKFKKFTAGVD